uniref:AB hydrolase-1 domain-containing protein n=2 Tax=Homalodisca liturata TaxID=320908 RepID=A0A1B6JJR5_9HEMI
MAEFSRKCFVFFVLAISYFVSFLFGIACVYNLTKRFISNPRDRFWARKKREVPPAVLNDPSLGNHAFVQLRDGPKLHYVENGDNTKPLMLLVHGFPEFWYSWRHQLREFSSDYWVVAVDMRGYGDSDKPAGRKNYTVDLIVADLIKFISALGRDTCTLVAHDWGGIVAWYMVLLHPHLFDCYVIMDSVHPVAYRKVLHRSLDQFRRSWYVFFFQLPYLPELVLRMDDFASFEKNIKSNKSPQPLTEEDLEAFKYTFGKPGALKHAIDYYRANFMLESVMKLSNHGTSEDFPPGLIMYGELDIYLSPEVHEVSVASVANAKLVCISGANHFVQQDDPESVNRELRKFFNEIPSKQQ